MGMVPRVHNINASNISRLQLLIHEASDYEFSS